MRRLLSTFLLLCSGVLGAQIRAEPPSPTQATTAALREVVRRAREGGFTGVILVSREGQLLLREAVGEADRRRHLPLTLDTRFRLASWTKQVTALLVMQEVEKGTLALNAPASTYLPTLSPSAGAVTLRQLLLHTSGLPNPSDPSPQAAPTDVPAFYTRTAPAAAEAQTQATGFCSGPVKRPAGERFEYNNCDYLVLGAVLERVTGRSYAQLIQERIARPLRSTTLGLFPPSSSATSFKLLSPAAFMISRPTRVLPVNASFVMWGWSAIARPTVGPSPGTTFTTPAGSPEAARSEQV